MKAYREILLWLGYSGLMGWFVFRANWGWWLLGIGLAVSLWWMDRLLYVWWLKPFEQLSIQIHYWWQRRDFRAVIKLLRERGKEQTRLMFRSVGFAFLWLFLTIYVLTSTGSVTAVGIVMGLGLGLAWNILMDWGAPQSMGKWFCWQIKRHMTEKEVRILSTLYLAAWMWMNALLLLK